MDLTSIVEEKIKAFHGTNVFDGLQIVLSHIKIAQSHMYRGRSGDDYLFTDAIYRTNQAFEGVLKEAYIVLSGDYSDKKTPYEIEQYLEKNNLLKERVLSLFKNYRTEWRNASTHNHKLYFIEQEAFLAIVNMYAFFNILLDQMLEKISYDNEKLKQAERAVKPLQLKDENLDSIYELLVQELTSFAKLSNLKNPQKAIHIFESEVLGILSAFITARFPKAEVFTEYPIVKKDGRFSRVDMLVKFKTESIIIELKVWQNQKRISLANARLQLMKYLIDSNVSKGILLIPLIDANQEVFVGSFLEDNADTQIKIVEIYPRSLE